MKAAKNEIYSLKTYFLNDYWASLIYSTNGSDYKILSNLLVFQMGNSDGFILFSHSGLKNQISAGVWQTYQGIAPYLQAACLRSDISEIYRDEYVILYHFNSNTFSFD